MPKKTGHIVNHYDSSSSSSSSSSSVILHSEVEGQIEGGTPNKNNLLIEPGGTTDYVSDTDYNNTADNNTKNEKKKQSKRAMICSLLTLLLSIPALIGA